MAKWNEVEFYSGINPFCIWIVESKHFQYSVRDYFMFDSVLNVTKVTLQVGWPYMQWNNIEIYLNSCEFSKPKNKKFLKIGVIRFIKSNPLFCSFKCWTWI